MADHYFSSNPQSELKVNLVSTILRNKEWTFHTSSGVFSKKKIDLGTQVLINNCIIKPNQKVLDFGCGVGVVGIIYKVLSPDSDITMIDINSRAIQISKMNMKKNNVNCRILPSNLFEKLKGQTFDTILTNPPQHAGKDVCFKIIQQAPVHLTDNGTLQLVARHQKGGRILEKKMMEVFGNVEQIAKKSGYRIYVSRKE